MSALELQARIAWAAWGDGYALWTHCSGCGQFRYCRGARRAYVLCLDCFDVDGPRTKRG